VNVLAPVSSAPPAVPTTASLARGRSGNDGFGDMLDGALEPEDKTPANTAVSRPAGRQTGTPAKTTAGSPKAERRDSASRGPASADKSRTDRASEGASARTARDRKDSDTADRDGHAPADAASSAQTATREPDEKPPADTTPIGQAEVKPKPDDRASAQGGSAMAADDAVIDTSLDADQVHGGSSMAGTDVAIQAAPERAANPGDAAATLATRLAKAAGRGFKGAADAAANGSTTSARQGIGSRTDDPSAQDTETPTTAAAQEAGAVSRFAQVAPLSQAEAGGQAERTATPDPVVPRIGDTDEAEVPAEPAPGDFAVADIRAAMSQASSGQTEESSLETDATRTAAKDATSTRAANRFAAAAATSGPAAVDTAASAATGSEAQGATAPAAAGSQDSQAQAVRAASRSVASRIIEHYFNSRGVQTAPRDATSSAAPRADTPAVSGASEASSTATADAVVPDEPLRSQLLGDETGVRRDAGNRLSEFLDSAPWAQESTIRASAGSTDFSGSSNRDSHSGGRQATGEGAAASQLLSGLGQAVTSLTGSSTAAPALGISSGSAADQPPATSNADGASLTQSIVQTLRFQAREGGGEARIQLRPEYLGELTVSLRVNGGAVSAVLHADSPAVRSWIEDHQQDLRAALEDQGLTLHELAIDTEGRSNQENQTGQQQTPSQNRRQPREGSAFEALL
jgi:flagellar hook-length control protein FliK